MEIKVGDVFTENQHPFREVHVLSIFTDIKKRNKIAIQKIYPKKKYAEGVYSHQPTEQAKVVTPSYFYGLTVKITRKVER